MSDDQAANLRTVAAAWWTPDAKIVSKLPKGGNKDRAVWRACPVCGGFHAPNAVHLDYVGHADLTRTLIEIDPLWSWEPFALDSDGMPLVVQRINQLVMWGRVTILGKTLPCVGTCDLGKPDADKELVGDLLRNAAMRFGIYGALWSKVDGWEDTNQVESSGAAVVAASSGDRGPVASGGEPVIPATSAVRHVAPEKPVESMTVRELVDYAKECGVSVSGSKADMVRVLLPYAMAASGEEPFDVSPPVNPPAPKDDAHDKPSTPTVANPATQARDALREYPPSARTSIRNNKGD